MIPPDPCLHAVSTVWQFDRFDRDKSGLLDYQELARVLHRHSPSAAVPSKPPGPRGADPHADLPHARTLQGMRPLRVQGSTSGTSGEAIAEFRRGRLDEQLSAALAKAWARASDLFREWDVDHSGRIDRKELRRAVAALGLFGSRSSSSSPGGGKDPKEEGEKARGLEAVDALFDRIDTDRTGSIDIKELSDALSHNSGRRRKASDTASLEYGSWIHTAGMSKACALLADPFWQPGLPQQRQRTLSPPPPPLSSPSTLSSVLSSPSLAPYLSPSPSPPLSPLPPSPSSPPPMPTFRRAPRTDAFAPSPLYPTTPLPRSVPTPSGPLPRGMRPSASEPMLRSTGLAPQQLGGAPLGSLSRSGSSLSPSRISNALYRRTLCSREDVARAAAQRCAQTPRAVSGYTGGEALRLAIANAQTVQAENAPSDLLSSRGPSRGPWARPSPPYRSLPSIQPTSPQSDAAGVLYGAANKAGGSPPSALLSTNDLEGDSPCSPTSVVASHAQLHVVDHECSRPPYRAQGRLQSRHYQPPARKSSPPMRLGRLPPAKALGDGRPASAWGTDVEWWHETGR
jgi:Ca2+-binding EF-hand superfamily protein